MLTEDLSDGFFAEVRAMSARVGAAPLDLLGCWMNESGVRSNAWNRGGDASGIFQAMPATLHGLHFPGDHTAFRLLTAEEQLVWAEKYYSAYRGRLWSAAACYVATFLPALLIHATEPQYVLCGIHGPFAWAYSPNRSFDHAGHGYITVQDLADAITRACVGPRWAEIAQRLSPTDGSILSLPIEGDT